MEYFIFAAFAFVASCALTACTRRSDAARVTRSMHSYKGDSRRTPGLEAE